MKYKINNRISKLERNLKMIMISSAILLIGITLSKIFTYAYRIIIARYFGPEEYGLFSLASMLLILIVALFSLGLPEGIVRYISFYRGKRNYSIISSIVRYSTLLLGCVGVIAGTLLFLLSETIALGIFHDAKLVPYIKLAALIIPFFVLANIYLAILRAFESIGIYSFILNVVQNAGKVAAIAILLLLGLKSNSIMLSYFIGIFLMFLFALIAVQKYYGIILSEYSPNKRSNDKIIKEMFSYSWPLSLMSVASFILYWVDSFFIGYFKSATEVGLYNAAVPLAALVMIAPDLIVQLFFPLVTKEYAKKDMGLIEQLSKQVTKWIFLVNAPIAIIIMLFPGAIINLFFGETYLAAESALRILAFGSLFGSLSIIPANLISMTGRTKLMLANILSMLIINIILNVFLVPKYGITGAALSTALVMIGISCIYLLQTRYFLYFIPLRKKMITILFACMISLMAISVIKQYINITLINLILLGALFCVIYCALIIVLRCLDENDLSTIKNAKKTFSRSQKTA